LRLPPLNASSEEASPFFGDTGRTLAFFENRNPDLGSLFLTPPTTFFPSRRTRTATWLPPRVDDGRAKSEQARRGRCPDGYS
jgi:hypothetical protein